MNSSINFSKLDSIRKAVSTISESNLSISSINSETSANDDSEIAAKMNSMLNLLSEAITDSNSENLALGNEILELLDILEISVKSLPIDIKEKMQIVLAILKSEGLSTVDETALKLCLERRIVENKKKEREDKLLKVKYNTAFSIYNNIEEKLSILQKRIDEVEESLLSKSLNDENDESTRILLTNKIRDYKETAKKLQEELDNIGDFDINQIMSKSSELMRKSAELNEINNELEQFKDLPPNLLQARKLLDFKKLELQNIEKLLEEKMNI